jgi:hypothetical protein
LLRKREKKRGERRGKKIQRDGGGLDGLREGYGVGQHAEHGLIQLEDMQKVQCRLKKYSRQDRYALEEIKWRWLASAIIARAEDQASRVGLEGKVLPAFHSVLAQVRMSGKQERLGATKGASALPITHYPGILGHLHCYY